ncbi:UbiD family decarboxylase [Tissierella creatinini]|nr:UbiD family decarboxylase [Tissierella creatinini]TJX63932.1 UbiD family decarboxylase [Soehngenia saccharolytica]
MLRNTIDKLKKTGDLLECNKEVDYIYEMGAVLKYFQNKKPILFNKVKAANMRTIGGLYGNRNILFDHLGVNKDNRNYRFMEALVNPKPYKIFNSGPIKENKITSNIDIQKIIPVNKFNGLDSSSFITAGVMVIKDPQTGNFHTSVRRLQVNKGNSLSALIGSFKLTNDFLELERQGKSLDVAIVLGYDATFLLASQYSSATYGVDKYELDSSLRGEPLELVKCETNDLLVPAHAEIVIEGKLVAGKRELEGPFGELMGYYGRQAPHPIIEVSAITYRNNPIYQTAFPCEEEHLTNGLIREMELYYYLKNIVDVRDVYVTEGGGYRFNAVISIKQKRIGEAKSAILSALGLNKDLKQVVIVDDDLDIYWEREIEWAITSRCQASNDIVIVPGALGSSLEPSHDLRGLTDKIGIDATKPIGNEKFERAMIPGFENIDIKKYF